MASNKFNNKNIDLFFAFIGIYALGLLYVYPLLTISIPIFLYNYFYNDTDYFSINRWQIFNLIIYALPLSIIIIVSYDLYKTISTFQQVIYTAPNLGRVGWGGQGSMIYPALQISAWGLYMPWHPMAIFAFKDFVMSPIYFFISSIVCILFLIFAIIKRYFSLLLLLIFSCFFAKGSAEPLGELFNFIINEVPGGSLIRSPDSKYGAIIASLYLILAAYLYKSRIFKYYFSVILLFTLINIINIYYKGAIDNYYGDHTTSSFAIEPESIIISKFINSESNAIVFTNLSECYSDIYDGKFHTCRGPLLSLINKQVVFVNSKNIKD